MNYTHLTGTFTTTGISGAGINAKLHSVSVNTKGVSPNLLTIADSKGTIAVIDTSAGPAYWLFDCDTQGQLTAASAAGTGGDITITWQ